MNSPTPAPLNTMPSRRLYVDVFAISLAVILLEITYTRVFSFKLFYYFTYLIIGLALLGLGAGGVLVTVSARLRRLAPAVLVPRCALAGGAAVLVGYLVVAMVPLNAVDLVMALSRMEFREAAPDVLAFAVLCGALQLPFLAAGLALASVFAHHPEHIGRLYAADLLGAALGCVTCVPLIALVGAPGAVLMAGLVLVVSGARRGVLAGLAVPVGLALAVGIGDPTLLPDPIPDRIKTMHPDSKLHRDVLLSRWSPVFRVDVMENPVVPDTYVLNHDGMWGSLLFGWNGEVDTLTRFETDARAHPFRLLPRGARVAVIGAAGGNEVLASLYFGASQVTAIELNPVTVSLLRSEFADITGNLATARGVRWLNAEGRSFLRSEEATYDLIWFVAPDSYAAMNAATSGAFVLSESYLYTVEMVRDALARLAPGGLICTQFGEASFEHKPNRTLRYLATARDAFTRAGIGNFAEHVLVATAPGFAFTYSTILLSKTPLTTAEAALFVRSTSEVADARVRHAPGIKMPDSPITRFLALPDEELDSWYDRQSYDLRPVTDDAPFFWHFVRFRDAAHTFEVPRFSLEDATGERLLLFLLVASAAFAAVLLLLPFATIRPLWRQMPYKGRAGIYFAAIGLGFLFLEITLIQRLTLFLGYPTYSLTVTLFALLLSTGVGSLGCEHYRGPVSRALLMALAVLAVLLLVYEAALTTVLERLGGQPFTLRLLVAALVVAPLGLCLGWFLPLGVRAVAGLSAQPDVFVAWSWAVNGFFSVLSSVLATILAMSFGFGTVMLAAGALYAIGVMALISTPSIRVPQSARC